MIDRMTTAPRSQPVGTPLVQCSRCHRTRPHQNIHPCPWCLNPEFGLVTVGKGQRLVPGWPGPGGTTR